MDNQTLDKLRTALDEFKTRLSEVPLGTAVFSDNHTDEFRRGHKEAENNLRLDWELVGDHTQQIDEKSMDSMFGQMEIDLTDLLENGDVENTGDPLLKTMDGMKKLGTTPEFIDITVGQMHAKYHWRKDATEVTVYVRLYVKWQ